MKLLATAFESKLATLTVPVALHLPDGTRSGAAAPRVSLRLHEWPPLVHLASGAVGRVAEDHVQGRIEIDGSMRDIVEVAAQLMDGDPISPSLPGNGGPLHWWHELIQRGRSRAQHTPEADARQVEFHYNVSDDFYALWLDPGRVYSCAYFRWPDMSLEQAQRAKLDHICRKLMLRPGDRFLDIGAGWGGLLLHAAESYGVTAHGITLSKNQHAHVRRLIDERGLGGRVTMQLCDYRELADEQPRWDKIASVGMFEHVGHAQLPAYFAKIHRLLAPGGLLLNHGITAGGTRNDRLGAGIGDFMQRYIFPGGELVHVSRVLHDLAEAGLEALDVENLRPHYARTLWAWSDGLEANLERASAVARDAVVQAYRLYLAGSAMSFERGWISLFQMLAARPSGDLGGGSMRGAQSSYPFNREYQYR